jgi:class 3 adenylate cyclase/tetratricopeptide (TPR) repeat protein
VTESSTLTVMFTDMVSSTERVAAAGEQTGEMVRRKLFDLLRGAMAAAGGSEVKNLGDGLMITFPTVRAGLEAAVLMQRRAARHNRREEDGIHLRIGMSVGDAVPEDGDWFGISVVEAARLCAVAAGDQILVTEKVELLADPGGPPLSSVGEIALKGLAAPTMAYQVEWGLVSPDERGRSLPRRLGISRTADFVARDRELECLLDVLDRADAGARQIALICGEPGIGKTTLAAEAACAAGARGARVLYGRNEEGIGTPFQPFVETLGDLVAQAPATWLEFHVAEHGGELRRLASALATRVPQVPEPRITDPESERYRLYAAIVDMLERATEDHPLLLIIDDLHWADAPTVQLLRYVLSQVQHAALAIVVTYRDTELADEHPLCALLADLHREQGVTRLELTGFGDSDVMALIERRTGQGLDAAGEALARTLQRETAGNPFFMGEILHSIEEGGRPPDAESGRPGEASLPLGVREVIRRRVRRLGEPTAQVLGTASVVGREFDLELLRHALDADEDELAGRLDAAVRASLLTELPGSAGRFVFPHALVPYALYEDLGPASRHRAHARVAEALEAMHGSQPGPRVAELAHHWSKTTASDGLRKAIVYSMAAGEQALAQLAPGEAADWYEKALELYDRGPDDNREMRSELLIRLGQAQALAGMPKHRETLFLAFETARELGDRTRTVRAALANGRGVYSSPGQVDGERVTVLEHALEAAGDRDSAERAELLARLADELVFAGDAERVRALSGEALAIVRRIDSPRVLIDVVAERAIAIWSPDTLPVRREEAEEAVQAAGRVGDPLARFHAYRCRTYASICAGELERAETDHAEAFALAERTAHPMARWMARVMGSTIATIRGRFEVAEALAAEAFDIAAGSGQPDAQFVYSGQLGQLWYEKGRLPELQPLIAETAKQFPMMPALIGILAVTAAEAGLVDDALGALTRGAEIGFAQPDITWAGAIGPHAIACARVEDRRTSRLLRPLLEPYAGQVAYTAANAWLTIDHHLGALARVDGHYDQADAHLNRAAEMARHMKAPVWLARTQVEQARARIARGHAPADVLPLLEEAHEAAVRLGAGGVERDAAALINDKREAITA